MDARVRFAAKALVFCCSWMLLVTAIERRLWSIPGLSVLEAKSALLAGPAADVEVLVVGSSHEANGIDPERFRRKGFNLADPVQSVHYGAALAALYQRRLTKLRVVLFGIDYHSLETRMSDHLEAWRAADYYRTFRIAGEPGWRRFDPANVSRFAAYGPYEALRAALGRRRAPGILHSGFEPLYGTEQRRNAARRLAWHHELMHEPYLAGNAADLEDLLRTRRPDVSVVFVTAPVSRAYSEAIDPVRMDRTRATLARFQRAYGAAWSSYLTDPRFEDADFWDSDHLNTRGAAKLSRILDEEVLGAPGGPVAALSAPNRGSASHLSTGTSSTTE